MPELSRQDLERALAAACEVERQAAAARAAIEAALGFSTRAKAMIPIGTAVFSWAKSDSTIRRWIKEGVIEARMIGGQWYVQADPPCK